MNTIHIYSLGQDFKTLQLLLAHESNLSREREEMARELLRIVQLTALKAIATAAPLWIPDVEYRP